MPELLRPPPPRSVIERARDALRAVPPLRLAGSVAGSLLAVVVAWWMLHTPSAPIEQSLPRASARTTTVAGAVTVEPSNTNPSTAVTLVVQAAGAVARPGVYRLQDGARVIDLINAAGGPTSEADTQLVALAATLTDGVRVYVPKVGESPPPPVGGSTGSAVAGTGAPVDLNAATPEQLDALPGVGPATAAAIVAHRQEIGRYASVEELLDVKGIGPAKLEAMRPLVTV
ncbi:MAG: helix-hairpin-helix domain-containing protein [Acidimicrobiales bacterium]